jgi:hypothetical protein
MKKQEVIDLDAIWKQFITDFIDDCVAFIRPDLHEAVDWSFAPVFLEQELLNALKGKFKIKNKRKFTDKLVKLRLKTGEDHYILLHAEAQHELEEDFNKRMYIYRSLIFLRYDIEDITAIAIFTGDPPLPQSLEFRKEVYGTELFYRYNSLITVTQDEEMLLHSDNPFAIAALAAKYAYHTKNNPIQRFTFKRQLFILSQKKNISREKLIKLLIFVRDFLFLPNDLENEFAEKDFSKIINSKEMAYRSEGTMMYIDAVLRMNLGLTTKQFKAKLKEFKKMDEAYALKIQETALLQQENKIIEQEVKQKEQEVKQKEQEVKQKEQEAKQKDIQREQERIKTILNLHFKGKQSVQTIAECMDLDIAFVQKIIDGNATHN